MQRNLPSQFVRQAVRRLIPLSHCLWFALIVLSVHAQSTSAVRLDYATLFGGKGADVIEDLALDAAGNIYLTGWTTVPANSPASFPTTPGALTVDTRFQAGEAAFAFVVKLNPAGTQVLYAALIGGTQDILQTSPRGPANYVLDNRAKALAVDSAGNVYVTGTTLSLNFPTTNGALQTQTTNVSATDAPANECFVFKLNPQGSALLYSTLLGRGAAAGADLAVNAQGEVWLTGNTAARRFPATANALQQTPLNSGVSAFVAQLNAAGTALRYATYLSSGSADFGASLALDASGNAYVTGATNSSCAQAGVPPVAPFPTTANAYRRDTGAGCENGLNAPWVYAAKFTAQGAFAFSTLIGRGRSAALAVDAQGQAVITGRTARFYDFPVTAGALQTQVLGALTTEAAFVTKLNADGSALRYSTFLNGAVGEFNPALALDGAGNAYVTGELGAPTFAATQSDGAFRFTRGAYAVKLNASGNALGYAVVFGGTPTFGPGPSFARGIALDSAGQVLIAGAAFAADFPVTPNALQTQRADDDPYRCDGFIVKLSEARTVANVSAASYAAAPLAAGSIIAAFGAGLATTTSAATQTPLPLTLANASVVVRDSANVERAAPLFFVSPTQINYLLPAGTANGTATVNISNNAALVAAAAIQIESVAPGLFSADASGRGLAAAVALRITAAGAQRYEALAQYDAAQNRMLPVPLALGAADEQVFLLLFGTGWRGNNALAQVTATIGGIAGEVTYAGPQGELAGLDQINVRLPRALIGRGEVEIALTVQGRAANPVKVWIK